MRTLESLESISDGKIYDINDMVKADAGGCEGCSACCEGVGELVALTPFDVYVMTHHLNISFEALLNDKIEIRDYKKIMMPHLKMQGEGEKCSFLNAVGRCTIHAFRPNICRLFPLGRVYLNDDFKYFLQVGACVKPKLEKVKVKKWIGIENYHQNKAFLLSWHQFIKALAFRLKFVREEQELMEINAYLQETFFNLTLEEAEDFYTVFDQRLKVAKEKLGVI